MDVRVAVKLDVQSLLDVVGDDLALASRGLGAERVVADDGGASGVVGDIYTWVGVVDGELVGECGCQADELCAHAVAVAVAAVGQGVVFEPMVSEDDE